MAALRFRYATPAASHGVGGNLALTNNTDHSVGAGHEIGDGGVRLSGGQRQRISLARALLADPRVLILDEATSMYDLEGEASLVEHCREALADRTVIIITHRPASLALADRIVELRDGQVYEVAPSPA